MNVAIADSACRSEDTFSSSVFAKVSPYCLYRLAFSDEVFAPVPIVGKPKNILARIYRGVKSIEW